MTQDELKQLLHYDPNTGEFTWLANTGKKKLIGKRAGRYDKFGNRFYININKKQYLAHRLAWLYVYGQWPKDQIDHVNGNSSDNRILNIRECNNSENSQNKSTQSNNSSGYIGVHYYKAYDKWRSRIQINNKEIHLGYFDTAEEAYEKYLEAKKQYHTFQPKPR